MKTYRVEMRDTGTKKLKYVDIFETDSESACATVRACANPFIEVVGAYELPDEYTVDDLGPNWW